MNLIFLQTCNLSHDISILIPASCWEEGFYSVCKRYQCLGCLSSKGFYLQQARLNRKWLWSLLHGCWRDKWEWIDFNVVDKKATKRENNLFISTKEWWFRRRREISLAIGSSHRTHVNSSSKHFYPVAYLTLHLIHLPNNVLLESDTLQCFWSHNCGSWFQSKLMNYLVNNSGNQQYLSWFFFFFFQEDTLQ